MKVTLRSRKYDYYFVKRKKETRNLKNLWESTSNKWLKDEKPCARNEGDSRHVG